MNIRRWFSISNACALIYALCFLQSGWLAFASNQYSVRFYIISRLIFYGCVPLGIIALLQQKKINKRNLLLLILPVFYLLVTIFYKAEGRLIQWVVPFINISCFLCFSKEFKLRIFKLTFGLFLIQCIFALGIWICYVCHIPIGFSEVPYYSENAFSHRYVKWGILAIFKNPSELRLCGIFNEPGGLGTFCALFFIATFQSASKWQKLLLLATGVCTYSLAFYLLIFLFAALHLIRKNYKNVVWLVLLGFVFVQIPNIDYGDEQINKFAQRFAFSSDRGLAGNNRNSELYDYEFSQLLSSNRVLVGYGIGHKIATTDSHGNSSAKRYIVEMGILGFGIFLLLWIMTALSQAKGDKDCYVLLFLFLLSSYQRPQGLIALYGFILVYGGFLWIQSAKEEALP